MILKVHRKGFPVIPKSAPKSVFFMEIFHLKMCHTFAHAPCSVRTVQPLCTWPICIVPDNKAPEASVKASLIIGLRLRQILLKVNLVDQEGDGEAAFPEVKDLQFTYIPSGAEIVSIDAFSRSSNKRDFVIGSFLVSVHV